MPTGHIDPSGHRAQTSGSSSSLAEGTPSNCSDTVKLGSGVGLHDGTGIEYASTLAACSLRRRRERAAKRRIRRAELARAVATNARAARYVGCLASHALVRSSTRITVE